MDILFYSNYCKHCEKIKQFIVKSNLTDKISAICIDKRTKDPRTGQIVVVLENGKQTTLPPNVHSVPSILIKSNFCPGNNESNVLHLRFVNLNGTFVFSL